jgi:hypothetical protein
MDDKLIDKNIQSYDKLHILLNVYDYNHIMIILLMLQ